jgi:hypothetical protein
MNVYMFGTKMRIEIVVVACILLGAFIALQTMCACQREGYESLTSSRDLLGAERNYSMGDGVKGSWEKALQVAAVGGGFPSFEQKNNTQNGGPPVPSSELVFFADTKFAPECCPSIYSSDQGCVCATSEQYAYLNQRGGNRTLSSEF